MNTHGSEFYDQKPFFDNYLQRRTWNENANDTIERPIIYEMMGDVNGKHVLDLGCGVATFGMELLDLGASFYTGVDGSINMVERAKAIIKKDNAEIIHRPLKLWDFPESKYDLIFSRLVIHYIDDIHSLFENIFKSLKPQGSFIFSVEHPVMTSSYGVIQGERTKQDWIVDNYFHSGHREQEWLGSKVRKFHRTIEEYFHTLQAAGFTVEQLRESKPMKANFSHAETYERRMRIPLFLFMKGRKET